MCTTRRRTGGCAAAQLVAVKVGAGYEISEAARRTLPGAARRDRSGCRRCSSADAAAGLDADRRRARSGSRTSIAVRRRSTPTRGVRSAPRTRRVPTSATPRSCTVCARPTDRCGWPRSTTAIPSAGVASSARCCDSARSTNRCTRAVPPTPAKSCCVPQVPQREVRDAGATRSSTRPRARPASTARSARRSSDPASCGARARLARLSRPAVHDRRRRRSSASVAARIGAAMAAGRARSRGVGAARATCAAELAEWIDHGDFDRVDEWLHRRGRRRRPGRASIEPRHDASTRRRRRSRDLFGDDGRPTARSARCATLVDPTYGALEDTFEPAAGAARSTSARVVSSTVLGDTPRGGARTCAIVRQRGRHAVLRRCYVAHAVPDVVAGGCIASTLLAPGDADWGHATELDDVRGAGRDRRASARPRTRRRRAAPRARSAPRPPSGRSPTRASSRPTSTGSRGRARSPTSTSPRSTSTSARRTTCGRRRGAAGWRGPRPRRTSRRRRSRDGQGPPRAQRVPGRVGDAARRR